MRTPIKLIGLLFSMVLVAHAAMAQDRPSPQREVKAIVSGAVTVEIKYSSPAVKGRKVWGDLVPYGEVWRTGANEATTFEISRDILLNGQRLPAGKYALFTIPGEKTWTLIFNKESSQWGAYNYKESMDALRVTNIKPKKASVFSERLEFTVSPKGKATIVWENLSIPFVIHPL